MPSYRPCMANNPAGTKLGAASHPQILSLEAVPFKGGRSCQLGGRVIPMQILHLFGLSAGDEVWVRVVGMLASIIGFYYLLAVRAGLDQFIPWTVPGRYFAAAFMAILVALKIVARGCCCLRLLMPLVQLGRGLPFDPRSKPSSHRAVEPVSQARLQIVEDD